jgi:hypothetical protein
MGPAEHRANGYLSQLFTALKQITKLLLAGGF